MIDGFICAYLVTFFSGCFMIFCTHGDKPFTPAQMRKNIGICLVWPVAFAVIIGGGIIDGIRWLFSDIEWRKKKPPVVNEEASYRDSAYMPNDGEE